MSIYRASGKGKRVVRVRLMQPCTWTSNIKRWTIPLKDYLNCQDDIDDSWLEPSWKTLDGKDMALYFSRLTDIRELLLAITGERKINNFYLLKLQHEYKKFTILSSGLDKVYTDLSDRSKARGKLFQLYSAPSTDIVDK